MSVVGVNGRGMGKWTGVGWRSRRVWMDVASMLDRVSRSVFLSSARPGIGRRREVGQGLVPVLKRTDRRAGGAPGSV